MTDDVAIKVEGVSKSFKLPHEKTSSIKGAVINFSKRRKGYEIQHALKDINFNVKKGEFFGIVGRNGSGKSTLLKLISEIYTPDSGKITVSGKLTPFIELGVGFNPELSGRDNVFLNGALLGFDRKEMNKMYQDIVDFAEIERFMDQKLKNYSSGMQVRLAFSIAIQAKSDILLLDEVLAVGDADFQRKCYDYFMSLKEEKQTVILVTHDMGAVRQYCDIAVMIEKGRIVKQGDPEVIAQEYQKLFMKNKETAQDIKKERWGEGGVKIQSPSIRITDEKVSIITKFKIAKNLPPPIYGFTLYNNAGVNVLEANTRKERYKTKAVVKGETVELKWDFPNILADGLYSLSVACCDQSTTLFYEWVNNAIKFNISNYNQTAGITNPKINVINMGDR